MALLLRFCGKEFALLSKIKFFVFIESYTFYFVYNVAFSVVEVWSKPKLTGKHE